MRLMRLGGFSFTLKTIGKKAQMHVWLPEHDQEKHTYRGAGG
jgi:hypothetical protein